MGRAFLASGPTAGEPIPHCYRGWTRSVFASDGSSFTHAFLWENGVMTDLTPGYELIGVQYGSGDQ